MFPPDRQASVTLPRGGNPRGSRASAENKKHLQPNARIALTSATAPMAMVVHDPNESKSRRSQGKIKMGSKRGRRHPDIVDAGWHQRRSVMPMMAELSIPAVRHGLRHASQRPRLFDYRPEPRMGTSADFRVACLWSAFGLTLTGLLFALGLGAEIGQILAIAG
jgi:hypothetical protein